MQAPLADPYAQPNLALTAEMDLCLRYITLALLDGYDTKPTLPTQGVIFAPEVKKGLVASLSYLKARIGVPRDMSYPAARQLRAHLTWVEEQV